MDVTNQYCVFDIVNSCYLFCHKEQRVAYTATTYTELKTYLLQPGVNHKYDSQAKLFVHKDPTFLITLLEDQCNSRSLYYSNRSLAEFEIQKARNELIPTEYYWRYADRIYV